jgi:hypothetical protein
MKERKELREGRKQKQWSMAMTILFQKQLREC